MKNVIWDDSISAVLQSQKAVTAYLESKQLLLFAFARQHTSKVLANLFV